MNQKGFTLVELVVVIVILGILAATALPRFVDVTHQARTSAVNGLAGGLRAASSVMQARYMAVGTLTATTVTTTDGTTVTVNAGTGVPTGAQAGIGAAVQGTDGFNVTWGATATFQPTNGGSATCQASYNGTTGVVTVDTSGC